MKAYTYLIGWSKQKMFYYGVRFAKGCKTSDLWTVYKTSSSHVKLFSEIYGDPDILQIRKEFNNVLDARIHEHKVLKRLQAHTRKDFLNRTTNKAFQFDETVRKKLSDRMKSVWAQNPNRNDYRIGKSLSSTTKQAIGASNKGRVKTPEERKRRAEAMKVKWQDPVFRSRMEASRNQKITASPDET